MRNPYLQKEYDSVGADIVWHPTSVCHEGRAAIKKQKPVVLLFTGLSGSGKSTIANAVDRIDTVSKTVEDCAEVVISQLRSLGYMSAKMQVDGLLVKVI